MKHLKSAKYIHQTLTVAVVDSENLLAFCRAL